MHHLSDGKAKLSASKQALLARMRQSASRKENTIPRRTQPDAPLSFAQQRLWFLDQFYPRSCAYNVPRVFRLTGQLDFLALQQALKSIAKRDELLRTMFKLM